LGKKRKNKNNDHETEVGENETKKLKGVFRLSRHLTKLGVKMSERSMQQKDK
jgi:hypothetical protein